MVTITEVKQKPLKAYKLYKGYFNYSALEDLYIKKISPSGAIGKDGIRKTSFEKNLAKEITLILDKVGKKTYHFTPYKEKLISKGPKQNPRQVSIPTRRDRLTLRAVCEILTSVFVDTATRLPHEYIKDIKDIVQKYDDSYCFLRIDVKDYYPSINHKKLLPRIRKRIRKPELIELIMKSITTPTGNNTTPPSIGIPQGLSISNILSSIYLNQIDQKYSDHLHYFRYVDDILIICSKVNATDIYKEIKKDLRKLSLKCHELDDKNNGKTTVSSLSNGIDYLGYRIKSHSISVRKSSYQRMFENLSKVFTSYKYSKHKDKELLLFRLNLKISGCIIDGKRYGWMFFFSQTEDKSQLKYLDKFIIQLMQQHGLIGIKKNVKTFIKSYHEIRYRIKETKYIENFESYDLKRKKRLISLLTGINFSIISKWTKKDIEQKFQRVTLQEARQLEKDLIKDS